MSAEFTIIEDVISLDEFIRRYDQEGPFEFLDGEIVPNVAGRIETVKKLFLALLMCEQQGLGEVFTEATFVLVDKPDWVKGSRIPDLMFYATGRLTTYRAETPNWERKPYILVPDLVIEVVSPNDSYSDINRRIQRYFEDGVQIVWVVDPQTRQVMIHQNGSTHPTRLEGDAVLKDSELLPGFELSFATLFA